MEQKVEELNAVWVDECELRMVAEKRARRWERKLAEVQDTLERERGRRLEEKEAHEEELARQEATWGWKVEVRVEQARRREREKELRKLEAFQSEDGNGAW